MRNTLYLLSPEERLFISTKMMQDQNRAKMSDTVDTYLKNLNIFKIFD